MLISNTKTCADTQQVEERMQGLLANRLTYLGLRARTFVATLTAGRVLVDSPCCDAGQSHGSATSALYTGCKQFGSQV
jgi:hypothetical protein